MHACINIFEHTFIHTCMHTDIHTWHDHTWSYMIIHIIYDLTCTHENIHAYMHTCIQYCIHTYHYEWQWGCSLFQNKTIWKLLLAIYIKWWPEPTTPFHPMCPPLRLTWRVRCFAAFLTVPWRSSLVVILLGPIWFDSAVTCTAHRSRNGAPSKNIHI